MSATDGSVPARIALITTHIAPATGYGGIAVSSARLARQWAMHNSVLLCASDASQGPALTPGDLAMPDSVTIHLYHAHGWRRWGFGLGALPAIWRSCLAADAVYVSGIATWPTSVAPWICHLLRRPVTMAVRGGLMVGHVAHIRTAKPLKWLFYRLITLPALRRARAIHATSQVEADGVRAMLPDADIVTVPNAIDLSAWPVLPPRSEGAGTIIGYVGRLSPEKGILPFIQAWLSARGPHDQLWIAGDGGGEYAARIATLAAGSDGAVRQFGYLSSDQVKTVLAGCDYVVLPSGMGAGGLRENFGNSVIEAMASGRPVLVSRGMAWDHVEPAGMGLTFTPDQAADIVRRAATLSTEQRALMAVAARRHVEKNYDIESVATRLLQAIFEHAE